MGQAASASRQAGRTAQRAAKNSGSKASSGAPPAPRPPPLGRPVADAPEVTEDAEKALKQRQQKEQQERSESDPPASYQPTTRHPPQQVQADQNTGFFRGHAPVEDPRDAAQEQFLVHQRGGDRKFEEMSPDLLNFLKDAGPLQKKVNKELTSKRVLDEIEKEGEQTERLHRFEAAQRQRNDMRLVEKVEGHTTPRTTNFFTSVEEEEDLSDFGLSDLEIYDLLKRKTDVGEDAAMQAFYKEKRDHQSEAQWTEEDRQSHQKLLTDTAKFLELPIVIKDEEASYIGAWPEELKEQQSLTMKSKLDVVDESRVKLVLADLVDLQRKEVKKLR